MDRLDAAPLNPDGPAARKGGMEVHHRRIRVVAAALFVGLLGCERPTEPEVQAPMHAWVVGEAARALDADGRFLLPPPVAPGPQPITSTATATELAATFLRMFTAPSIAGIAGSTVAGDLERQRRDEIDFKSLVPADRAFYAESPYLPLDESAPPFMRKYLGPFFLVPFLDQNGPAVVMASSAYNTDISIVADQLFFPPIYGNDFSWAGIPVGVAFVFPITPERAVEAVWHSTETRVDQIPELIAPHRLFIPHYARWRVSLENPIRVRGVDTGREHTTSELYISASIRHPYDPADPVLERIEIALPQQPRPETISYACPTNHAVCEVVVERRPGFPTDFEIVQVLR